MKSSPHTFPVALLGVWLLASLVTLALATDRVQEARSAQQRELEFVLDASARSVMARVNMMALASNALRAGITSQGTEQIKPESVYAYLRRRDSEKEFPGSSGFGFIRRVAPKDIRNYLNKSRENKEYPEELTEFQPHTGNHYVVEAVVPPQIHEKIHGLDIASEPHRKLAADLSATTGLQQMTAPLQLVRKSDEGSAGFLLLTPIYSDQLAHVIQPTDKVRNQNLVGWIYAAFLIEKLLNHAQLNEQLVHLQITDVTDGKNPVAVFNNRGSDTATSLRSEKTMSVFGRQWRIVAWPAPAMSTAFQGAQIQIAQFLLFELCLTLVCVTAFLVVRTQRLKSDSISQMADNKASEEKRWKDMADRLPQLVWTCTPEGHCDYLSARWQQFTGIDSDKQLGDKWLQQIHPDDRPALLKDWATAVAERSSFCAEFRIRRFDGEYIWFDTRATPVFDHNGQLSRWVGSNTDIHAQHEAQQEVRTLNLHLEELVALRTQALTESKRKVQLILDTVPSLIGYWTVDLINVFANHAYEDWFGRKPKSLPGTHLSGLLPIEVYQNTLPKIKRVLAGERMTFLNKFPDLNGNGERFGLVSMLPDLVEGDVVGFFVSMQDVTEIQKAREAAMASSSAKSKFLATVGHEIRNPLNNILGSTIILSEEVDNPDVLESLEGIRESAHSIRVILDDLLDLSAFESGRLNIEHVEFD